MKKKKLKIINKNILDITKGVLIHQVNQSDVLKNNISKNICGAYPMHCRDYTDFSLFMGSIVITAVNDDLGIMAFISEDCNENMDYHAFQMCLERLRRIHSCDETIDYYIPYGIGEESKNRDWNKIYNMILDICPFVILVQNEK